jgi:hypothetical protein
LCPAGTYSNIGAGVCTRCPTWLTSKTGASTCVLIS